MPIPTTRDELVEQLHQSFEKLKLELDKAGPQAGKRPCVDDWTVKDLLAVRAWWSESVVAWIETGRNGGTPVTPAEGYRWNDTPRLNADIVKASRGASYTTIRARLEKAYERVRAVVDELTDHELLDVGVFAWAGKYPVRRWISLNTVRQYTTARTYIRRAVQNAG